MDIFKNNNYSGLLHSKPVGFSNLHKVSDIFFITSIFIFITYSDNLNSENSYLYIALLLIPAINFFILSQSTLYKSFRSFNLNSVLKKIFINWTLTFLCINFSLYLINKIHFFGQINSFLSFYIFTFLTLCTKHILIHAFLRFIRISGGNSRNVIFWGPRSEFETLVKYFDQNKWLGFKIHKWFFKKSPQNINEECKPINKKFHGTLECLKKELLSNEKVDKIFFSDTDLQSEEIKNLISIIGNSSIPASNIPRIFFYNSSNYNASLFNIDNFFTIDLWARNKTSLQMHLKRLLDIAFSLFCLILFSPLMLLISILILFFSKGPIFFLQERYGLDCKKFKIIKFRTMKVSKPNNDFFLEQATLNDPRFTKFGKFLRNWSLDELPQFFNVLRGQMSVVGPRPHAISHNEFYRKQIFGYMQRHTMKPGITGLAQVHGFRGNTQEIDLMKKRINLDLQYLKEWNLILDFKIILKSIFKFYSKK